MDVHETYVEYKTAKLLNKLGFDWETEYCYDSKTKEFLDDSEGYFNFNEGDDNDFFSAPTLSIAQKWLRDEKNINIYLQCYMTPEYDRVNWLASTSNLEPVGFEEEEINIHPNSTYGTYEDELENCIVKCLEWLIKQENKKYD